MTKTRKTRSARNSRFHGAAAKQLEALALNDDNKPLAKFERLVRTFGIDSAKSMTPSGAEQLAEQWADRQAARLAGKKGGNA